MEHNKESSFKTISNCFSQTNRCFFGLVKNLNFSIFITIALFSPFVIYYRDAFGPEHFLTQINSGVIGVSIQTLVLFMSAIWLYNKTEKPTEPLKLWPFTLKVTWPLIWEGFKALVIICFGFIFFIIPGVIKTVHYAFLPYVIFFNKNYHAGKINALKHSKHLSKGFGWWIVFLFIINPTLTVEFVNNTLQQVTLHSWLAYLPVFIAYYIFAVINQYFFALMFFVYRSREQYHSLQEGFLKT